MSSAPLPASFRNRVLRVVSEAMRERETFKYEASNFAGFPRNTTGHRLNTAVLSTSHNIVLTALAQLGVYRTGAQRAFISLFDAEYEYIIAEATAAMALAPDQPAASNPDSLWFCRSAMPRSHWIGEQVLAAAPSPEPTDPTELPLFLADICSDPRSATRPICRSLTPGLFYAAVPIRTPRGIDIGTYCVISSTKMETWDGHATDSLRTISHAIMEHLEGNRIKYTHRRNVRVSRGLRSFLEGKATLSGWKTDPNTVPFRGHSSGKGVMDPTQQQMEVENHDDEDTDRGLSVSTIHFHAAQTKSTGGPLDAGDQVDQQNQVASSLLPEKPSPATSTIRGAVERGNTLKETVSGINGVYDKAANIIREAFEVDGCVFFDVTVGSYRRHTVKSLSGDDNPVRSNGQFSSTSSSDEQPALSSLEESNANCETLGFSTNEASSINAVKFPQNEGNMPKAFLATLLRRYPQGRVFNYDAIGELQASDSSEDDSIYRTMRDEISSVLTGDGAEGPTSTTIKKKQAARSLSYAREGVLIQQAFPGARSVAFMPAWDVKRERWFAASFIYTSTPLRAFTPEAELSNLNVFAKLIATEVNNMETLQSNQAKSDALGSLSHELRSPLHGVILGTELLNDTNLSVFQSNAAHTIETCSRTLLDTIDHLLDYSKLNSFALKRNEFTMHRSPADKKTTKYNQFGKKRLHSDISIDVLLEEVVESVFAGYSFQRRSIQQSTRRATTHLLHNNAHNQADSAQAMEQLGAGGNSIVKDGDQFGNVAVNVYIDPTCDWLFYVQAGAIRRIIMNLFGNSVKYTTRGTVLVSLGQEEVAATKRGKTERVVKLVVQDTGKGISNDFLQHKLYQPFSQEDELAPGTGLGLSLVKTIVTQLRGRIFVESQVGVGTKFTVRLPLEQASGAAESREFNQKLRDADGFREQKQDLKGLRVKCVGFETGEQRAGTPGAHDIVEGICRDWLHLDLLPAEPTGPRTSVVPEVVVIWSGDAESDSIEQIAQLKRTPNVVVCQDAAAAYQLFTRYQSAGSEGAFEFISQPLGPRKLAKAMHLAYRRWMGLAKLSTHLRPVKLVRRHSSFGNSVTQSRNPQYLPCAEPVTEPTRLVTTSAPEEPVLPPAATPASPNEYTTHGKLLLVDDNIINVKVLSAYVARLGLEYQTASNGKEAVDAYTAGSGRFAAVLMDISMPVMNGFEATRAIRTHEYANKSRRVPILALTGLASESAQREALESGVDVFLTKPVRLQALSESLTSMSVLQPAAPNEGNE